MLFPFYLNTVNYYPTMLPGGTMPGSEGEGTWIGGNGGNMKGSYIALSRFLRNPLVVMVVI